MREASKEHIISTALKLFSEKGYYATSIAQIAQEAGISKGLMYNYFASKEKLLEAIMVQGLESFIPAPLEGGKPLGSIEDENIDKILIFVKTKYSIDIFYRGNKIFLDLFFSIYYISNRHCPILFLPHF